MNEAQVKIGADELPAVTQLFTEPYMVQFLLHNTLGAWWAGKVLAGRPAKASAREAAIDGRVARGLRIAGRRLGVSALRPREAGLAAGGRHFSRLAAARAEIRYSTRAAAAAISSPRRWPPRALRAEEGLSPRGRPAVLRDNSSGWKSTAAACRSPISPWRWGLAGGPPSLPNPNIAWVGAPPPLPKPSSSPWPTATRNYDGASQRCTTCSGRRRCSAA